MIDGVHIDEHVLLVALGIDANGKKHVLGVREGATENAVSCTALLADLRDRGLHTDRPTLVVIDGRRRWRRRSAMCSASARSSSGVRRTRLVTSSTNSPTI
jgi:transposase-like protein